MIGLEDPEIVVNEDVGTVEVCVRILDGELAREVTVTLTTSDGTAVGTCQLNSILFNFVNFVAYSTQLWRTMIQL